MTKNAQRLSQLISTFGPGAMIDLPTRSVVVGGLEQWDMKGNAFLASEAPTQSRFFTMFMRGLLLRMGRQTEVDFGLDFRILHVILDNLKEEIEEVETEESRRRSL